jgi:hypothetical protein
LVREFTGALDDPAGAQERALGRCLRALRRTGQLRALGLPRAGGSAGFRGRAPLVEYDDIAGLVERQRNGEPDVLVPGRPVMFARTSGTTGRSKYIPVTRRSYLDFHFAQSVWRNRLLCDHREGIMGRSFLTVVSPAEGELTPAGIPCGAITGKIYLSQSPATRRFFPVPHEVMALEDARTKYYLIARLAAGADIGVIATANASTLLVLADEIAREAERLARDLERGSLSLAGGLPEGLAARLEPRLAPRPAAAARIREVLAGGGRLEPRHLWPRLEVAAVWLGGAAGFFVPRLRELYAPRALRDPGFSASEGFFAVPLADDRPDGAPVLSRVFMEFLPEDRAEDGSARTLLSHELDQGGRYFLAVTTTGGLLRYRMGDLVEVTGRCGRGGRAPLLRFLSKGRRILSLTGEKVSEAQATEAVARAVARSGLHIEAFTVSVRMPAAERPGYLVAVEPAGDGGPRAGLTAFLSAFEEELRGLNVEYREKRDSLRLSAPVLLLLAAGSYARYRADRLAGGAHDGQIKPPNLLPMEEFEREFQAADFVTMREGGS